MTVSEMEELVPEEMGPQGRRQRRVIVAILGTLLTIAVCVILGATFVQGSWWYAYSTDRLLDDEAIARVEAIHDLAEASGVTPEAVRALEAALEPSVHPSDVRMHLILAQETLRRSDVPELVEAAQELAEIIQTMQRPPGYSATKTPYTTTLEPLEW